MGAAVPPLGFSEGAEPLGPFGGADQGIEGFGGQTRSVCSRERLSITARSKWWASTPTAGPVSRGGMRRFNQAGHLGVLLGPLAQRDGGVGHIAGEGVGEGELALGRRLALAHQQPLGHQPLDQRFEVLIRPQLGDRVEPEGAAHHRRIHQQIALPQRGGRRGGR